MYFVFSTRKVNLFLNLFSLMVDVNIPDIALEPDKAVAKVNPLSCQGKLPSVRLWSAGGVGGGHTHISSFKSYKGIQKGVSVEIWAFVLEVQRCCLTQ